MEMCLPKRFLLFLFFRITWVSSRSDIFSGFTFLVEVQREKRKVLTITMILTTFAVFALTVLNLFAVALAAPLDGVAFHYGSCEHLLERKEWRALSDSEKKGYIDAVKCLQSQPAWNTSRPASWTRFDEFQAHHIEVANQIHFVGQFLPWHRQYLMVYETALRDECGYDGSHPYWNWSLDADSPNLISQSPIWDPVTGFGGDGVPGTYIVPPDPANNSLILPFDFRGCVQDGPFADYILKMGPGLLGTEHCLTRGFNNSLSPYLTSSFVAHVMSFPTFEQFRVKLEGLVTPTLYFGPHLSGHSAVGGEMSNFFSGPGDPTFFLHHANIDRIWWNWQQLSRSHLYAIGGPTSIYPPVVNLTYGFPLQMGDLGPTVSVGTVLNIYKNPNCYTYL